MADELRMQKVLQATSDAKVEVIPIGDMLDEHLANGDEYGKNELTSYTAHARVTHDMLF